MIPQQKTSMCAVVLCALVSSVISVSAADEPRVEIQAAPDDPRIRHLGWDTEGGGRHRQSLLLPGQALSLLLVDASGTAAAAGSSLVQWQTTAGGGFDIRLIRADDDSRTAYGNRTARLIFPFDPGVTPTTVLPSRIDPDDTFHLPAIVSAPDFGQMLVTGPDGLDIPTRLTGSRKERTVQWSLEFPAARLDGGFTLRFRPVRLPPPAGLDDDARWRLARRGWFDGLSLTSAWGEAGRPYSAPPGILGNNVVSDVASLSLWMYADLAFFVPELPGGIRTGDFVRRSVDHWLDRRMKPDGNVFGYWAYDAFLDSNPSLLISAWDYAEMSDDRAWLAGRIGALEKLAAYLLSRDVDGDGLIEAVPSGNRGTLRGKQRSSNWWDAVNFGHQDGYANALAYRALRCLADLETKLGRGDAARTYADAAARLRAAYAPALRNPATGWLAMWRSADGELHDYASPVFNGYAIAYGLVDRAEGAAILGRIRERIKASGFTSWAWGVPPVLDPIRPDDYLQPAIGAPSQPDGRDTWQQYMNGALSAGHVYEYLLAHHVAGDAAEADRILDAMLPTAFSGGFQNGVRDAWPQGIDWRTWDGKPAGYEGFLADNARFLLAVLTRNRAFRDRLYRPLVLTGEK